MDYREYIRLARQLGKNNDEASLRSAASRAYYGAFHFAGERLEQVTSGLNAPFYWTAVHKSHPGLQGEWRRRFPTIGHTIANLLLNAHNLRKKADYDMHLSFTVADKNNTFGWVAQILREVRKVH